MSSARTIFVVGSGPLIGSHVARLFAEKSFTHVALFSRSASNLSRDAAFVQEASSSVTVGTFPVDVTDSAMLKAALENAVSQLGLPEVVVFNAARINMSPFGDYAADEIIKDFEIPNIGLYTTASVMLPRLKVMAQQNPSAHPSLFVTSGAIIHQPAAFVFSLSMAKAAQATMTRILADENNDIHVALVLVGGEVSLDEKINNPANIATKFWELFQQKEGSREFEIRCGC